MSDRVVVVDAPEQHAQAREMSGAEVHLAVWTARQTYVPPDVAANRVGRTPGAVLETAKGRDAATPRTTTYVRTHAGVLSGKALPTCAEWPESEYTLRPGAPLLQGVPL